MSWEQISEVTKADGGDFSQFGQYCKISGNYAMVSDPDYLVDRGRIVFYERKKDGKWEEVNQITGNTQENIGKGIDLDGNYAIAYLLEDGTYSKTNVYKRNTEGVWEEFQVISNPDDFNTTVAAGVAISGNLICIGYPTFDGTGRVYWYVRSSTGGTWNFIGSSTGTSNDARFGTSISISGNLAVVSEPSFGADNSDGAINWFKFKSGEWELIKRETFKTANTFFGQDVKIDGNYAIVGAPGNSNFTDVFGFAYIYEYRDGDWVLLKTFSGDAIDDEFGKAVSISGDYAIVGAPLQADDDGRIHYYQRKNGEWEKIQDITGSTTNARLGYGAAISGNYAIASGFEDDGEQVARFYLKKHNV